MMMTMQDDDEPLALSHSYSIHLRARAISLSRHFFWPPLTSYALLDTLANRKRAGELPLYRPSSSIFFPSSSVPPPTAWRVPSSFRPSLLLASFGVPEALTLLQPLVLLDVGARRGGYARRDLLRLGYVAPLAVLGLTHREYIAMHHYASRSDVAKDVPISGGLEDRVCHTRDVTCTCVTCQDGIIACKLAS